MFRTLKSSRILAAAAITTGIAALALTPTAAASGRHSHGGSCAPVSHVSHGRPAYWSTPCASTGTIYGSTGFAFRTHSGFVHRSHTGFVYRGAPAVSHVPCRIIVSQYPCASVRYCDPCQPVYRYVGPTVGVAHRGLAIGGTRQFYPRSFRGCRW